MEDKEKIIARFLLYPGFVSNPLTWGCFPDAGKPISKKNFFEALRTLAERTRSIDKILRIVSECKYGIHDISRTELDKDTNLPRFNMPLELGIFLGAKQFGDDGQKKKVCLILDREPYRYQGFISDIAGQDIQSHKNDDSQTIKIVRNWLRAASGRVTIPGGAEIFRRYRKFISELPVICKGLKLTIDEMIFNDYTDIVSEWLKQNP